MLSQTALFSLSPLVFAAFANAFAVCPLVGPNWPALSSVGSSTIVQAALKDLSDELDTGFETGNTTNGPIDGKSTSISIALFDAGGGSGGGKPYFYEYHHAAPSLGAPVSFDSIYRIGDLSQVLIVYAFLVQAGDDYWHERVTKYVPELKKLAGGGGGSTASAIEMVDWSEVTLGELASHMAGIGRDVPGVAEVTDRDLELSENGFPKLRDSESKSCGRDKPCSRSEFFSEFAKRKPVFAPGTTPIYSNAAFQILSYALESISGAKFEDILQSKVLKPLSMSSTTLKEPKRSQGAVIPRNATASGWSTDMGDSAPATGMYSSVSDLARLGSSILASKLLKPATTRRWLQPVSHTSNTVNSVGAPWEIYNSARKITDHVIDVYLKLGTVGAYSSYLGVVPAYNVGFAILAAGSDGAPDLNAFADVIASNVLPAVVETAARQAGQALAGTYSTGSGKASSFIAIEVDAEPGLSVTNLTSRGADTRAAYAKILGIDADALSVRLFPTNLRSAAKGGQLGRFAFRAVFQDMNDLADAGTPTCISWMSIDSPRYGGEALDEFVFGVDAKGNAVEVEVPALRLTLEREGRKSG